MKNHSIHLDVCRNGCGGIWFEWMELQKVDESHEADPEFLQQLSQNAQKSLPLQERVECPQCDDIVMSRRFWSVKRQVEVDECAQCGGVWLDAGELTHIYSLFKTEAERKQAAEELFNDLFADQLDAQRKKSEQELATARKIAHALRFICPSYYIPGKQKGGAF